MWFIYGRCLIVVVNVEGEEIFVKMKWEFLMLKMKVSDGYKEIILF